MMNYSLPSLVPVQVQMVLVLAKQVSAREDHRGAAADRWGYHRSAGG